MSKDKPIIATVRVETDQFGELKLKLDEFYLWLKEQEALAGQSEKAWREQAGNCEQSIYRNGMWYASHEAVAGFRRTLGTFLTKT